MNFPRSALLLLVALLVGGCATPMDEEPAAPTAAGAIQPPFGMMTFAGPPAMDRAPRPRALPGVAALRTALERDPAAEAVIRFTVTAKGKPKNVTVARATDPAFAQLAKAYVEKMEFRPARAEGRSVACEVVMPFGRN